MATHKIRNSIFSAELARLMAETGATQALLADIIKVSQPTIYRYLSGQEPKASELMNLAQYFDVLPEQLLKGGAKTGDLSKKYLRDHPPSKKGIIIGPGVPLRPHPIYTEISRVSADLMELRQKFETGLSQVSETKKQLDAMQLRISILMQRAAQLDDL